MYKALIIFITAFFAVSSAHAQQDTMRVYMKNSGATTANKDSADYLRLIIPPDPAINKELYKIYDYYMDGKRRAVSSVLYKNGAFSLEGPYTEFFNNGRRKRFVTYKEDQQIGDMADYYPNGKLYVIKRIEKRAPFIVECRDTIGNVLAENGEGRWLEFDLDLNKYIKQGTIVKGSLTMLEWLNTNVSNNNDPISNPFPSTKTGSNVDTTHFIKVDVPPTYPDGIHAFYQFVFKNIKYPAKDKEKHITGKVFITFVVEKDGTLSNIAATQGPSESLKAEGVRMFNLSQKWIPGKANGKPVRVRYTLPFSFTLDGITDSGPAPMIDSAKITTENIDNISVDILPQYKGGIHAFNNLLSKNIKYPKVDKAQDISGKVMVSFVIEKDGSVSDVHATEGPSETLMTEAVRLVRLSPAWIAGTANGQPARIQFNVPINFHLDFDGRRNNRVSEGSFNRPKNEGDWRSITY